MEQKNQSMKEMKDCRGTAHRARIMPIIQIMMAFVVAICICMGIFMGIGIARNNYIAYNMNKHTNIKAEEEVIEAKTYSVYMILNELDNMNASLAGNKIKILDTSENLGINVCNVLSDAIITPDSEGNIEVPGEGIKLKLEIKENEIGNIEISNAETVEGYVNTFKKATIEVNATEGKLEAYVKSIVKENDSEEVTIEESEENTVMFMYEEEENGVIKIKGNEYVETYYVIASINGLTEEELEALEDTDWQLYDRENGIAVEKNGIIYAKSRYHEREFSSIKEISIRNIDKINPIVEVEGQVLSDAEDEITVTLGLKDGDETEEYGKSGLFGYAVTTTEDEPDEFIEIEKGEAGAIMRPYSDGEESEGADVGAGLATSVSEGEKKFDCIIDVSGITENGKYYAWVIDKAGNIAHIEFNVTEIEEQESGAVVIILDAPKDSLIGTEYDSLDELMEALKTNGITKNSGTVTAQMVNDVKNDSTTITNQDIILDLNGYTIASKLQEPAISISNGSLKVLDEKYAISDYIEDEELASKYTAKEDGIGKIENAKYVGIKIAKTGSLTIGDSGEIYAIVNTEAPIIEGKSKGIYNNGGTFNFYGGQIIAEVPIEGEISDTPILYDTTADLYGDGRIVAKLGKLAEIEAMIGLERYIRIEDAINDANEKYGTSEEPIEIDVTADISRLETIEIPDTKNIILDLNGYKIIGSSTGYILTNSGKLNIKDSSGSRGEIKSTAGSGIYNNEEAEIEVNGGTITAGSSYGVGIFNANASSVVVNDGKIIGGNSYSSPYYGAGIRNDGNGEVIVNGGTLQGYNGIWNKGEGTVNVSNANIISNQYGICNEITGTVNITGGTITGSGNGIYNKGTGRTEITGGTISGGTGIYNKGTGEVIVDNAIIKTTSNARICYY